MSLTSFIATALLAVAATACAHDWDAVGPADGATGAGSSGGVGGTGGQASQPSGGGGAGGGGDGSNPTQGGTGGDLAIPSAGTALAMDGANDAVRALRLVADDFTLEAWIKTTSTFAGKDFFQGMPLIYADAPATANDFGTSILNGHFCFGIGVPSEGVDRSVESMTLVNTGRWTHVAAVRKRSAGSIQVFVDGVPETSLVTSNTAPLDAPGAITLGANEVNWTYQGQIDEVRIWSVARTAEEIQSTMHRHLRGDESGLVTYFRLDEGMGTRAVDSSPQGNAGVLEPESGGGPTYVSSNAPITE